MNDLKLVFRSLKERCRGNQFLLVFIAMHRPTIRVLTGAPQVAAHGAESAVYVCLVHADTIRCVIVFCVRAQACLVNPADRQANRQTIGCENDHSLKSY